MLSIYAPRSGWTPELKQEVCDLWGTMTASQIMAELNGRGYTFTRNAIIGQLHRAGKTIEHKTAVHPQTPDNGTPRPRVPTAVHTGEINKARVRASKPQMTPAPFVCQDATDIVPLRLTLGDLEKNDGKCRWPYDATAEEQGPFVFCGHQVRSDGKPYCGSHCRVAYVGIPTPKRPGFVELGKSSGGTFRRTA